jgi:hypothetical protein
MHNPLRVLIIGGLACGPKAASRLNQFPCIIRVSKPPEGLRDFGELRCGYTEKVSLSAEGE